MGHNAVLLIFNFTKFCLEKDIFLNRLYESQIIHIIIDWCHVIFAEKIDYLCLLKIAKESVIKGYAIILGHLLYLTLNRKIYCLIILLYIDLVGKRYLQLIIFQNTA